MSADLNRALDTLHDTAERIASNLVDLEVDSRRQLLDASSLEGETAAKWTAANNTITELWRLKGLLEAMLAEADKLRGSRRADELKLLLTGRSIELASMDVPVSQRDLLGGAQAAERCTPDELLRRMSAMFDDVKSVAATVSDTWDRLVPQLDEARTLAQRSERLAADLGETGRADLAAAVQELAALNARVLTDPLSVGPRETERLTATLREVHGDLEASAELKRGFDGSMAAARELLAQLRGVAGEVEVARAELLAKISVPVAPPVPTAGDQFEPELAEVASLVRREEWRVAQHRLNAWTARANARLTEARSALEATRAPIAARNQFRSLLDAYQAKAKRLGLLEDAEAANLYNRAHDVLYTAPTDLAMAAQLVRGYQQLISRAEPTPGALR
jgi:hypothetical protein